MSQRLGGKPRSLRAPRLPVHGLSRIPGEAPMGRDTSEDGVLHNITGGGKVNAVTWHRKVLADFDRWAQLNPGVPPYQGKKAR